jgi:predicted nucleic acid-binding Zn ribbon protein
MPIYVYRNLTTGETFEVEQRMVDAALTTDPTTGDPVKRLIQPVGIAFKGSGFYVTDSRGSKGASAAAAPGSSASNGAAKGDGAATESASKGGAGSAETGSRSDAAAPAPPAVTKTSGSTGAAAAD